MLKNTLFAISLLGLLVQPKAQELNKTIVAPVTEVTVFLNQAQVTRSVKTSVNAGITIFRFEKISPSLIEQSLQVHVDDRVQILSVTKKNNHLTETEKPTEIIILEDSLEQLEHYLTVKKQAKEALIIEKDVLLANKQLGGTQTGVKGDELEDVLYIFRKRLGEINKEWLTHTEEEKKLNTIKNKLAAQLREFNQGSRQLSTVIEVAVKSSSYIDNCIFELSYITNNVSWKPYYEVRVAEANQPISFILNAQVKQRTGEDWSQVKLKLTTSNPLISGVKPEINPKYIRFAQPVYNEVKIQSYKGKAQKQLRSDAYLEDASSDAMAGFTYAETMMNAEFKASGFYSIASNNLNHKVELQTINANAIYRYTTVPSADCKVYVTARIPSIDIVNQIQAEAEVYFQGTFTGKTFIVASTNDTLDISLGVDRRILVERKKLKEFSSKSFFGSTKTESSIFQINIKNNRKETVEILVEDQIPVTTDKEIEINLTDNPDKASLDANTGKLTWVLQVEPNKSKQLKFGFDVKYPKNKMITGY